MARGQRTDGSYLEGPGPPVRAQSQLTHQVALGQTLLVIPTSNCAWRWPERVAVPVTDVSEITTDLTWPAGSRSRKVRSLGRIASTLD